MFLFHVFIFVLMALSICSINVTGIKEKHKRSQLFSSLRAENCDIYLLQETHVQSVQEGKLWERDWGGQAIFSPGSNHSAGVGILIDPRSSVEIVSDPVGRLTKTSSPRTKLYKA